MNTTVNVKIMPEVLSKYIQLFAKPITRPNWKGGAFSTYSFYKGLYELNDILLEYYMDLENDITIFSNKIINK